MLSSLKIRHLALVEDLTWELGPGLLGVTGETGAGKSIIVGALKLLLGERADRGLIRAGEETCTVEANFTLTDPSRIDAILEEAGVERCQDGELLIKRVIAVGGGNKQFVNCAPVTLQILKAIGEHLVDLHGPHDHQSLHSQERQLEMLDRHAGVENLTTQYQQAWQTWRDAANEWQALAQSEQAGAAQIEMLRFQIAEIADAALRPDEEQDIEARHRIAANGARLTEICGQLIERLGDGPGGIQATLRDIVRLSHELERIDPSTLTMFEGLQPALIELREIDQTLQDYAADLEVDPAELNQLDARLTTLQALKRKYGGTIPDILRFHDEAVAKLSRMENRGEELQRLEKLTAQSLVALNRLGKKLSESRAAAAPKLAAEIAAQLTDLGFKRPVFSVELIPLTAPSKHGLEDVDFVFAPNPGEPSKPLRLTASSGEMSRVLLAVKSALAKQDAIPLLVFDEIDANVGGNIAEAVGRKMAELGCTHQVIAITHFPQVASLAKSHYVVIKNSDSARTTSTIQSIEGPERIDELARMLGGNAKSARLHAESLLAGATS